MISRRAPSRLSLCATFTVTLLSATVSHAAFAEKKMFQIEARELSSALVEFGRQSATELLFAYEVVKDQRANAVMGEYEPVDALRILLKGTDLRVYEKAGGALVVSREPTDTQSRQQPRSREGLAENAPRSPSGRPGNRLRLAQATNPSQSPAAAAPENAAAANSGGLLEEVIVTGTAGGAEINKLDASFAISTVSAQEIRRVAPLSTADLLKTIPGVWSESSGGVSGANIMVRGLPGGGDAPWLTVQIDGVPVYPPSSLSFLEGSTLFRLDETIERLEALRGGPNPVFSNGQPGLTTNFILKEGSEETEGSLKYTTSDYDLRRVDGVVSGKISDGFYYMMGGYLSSSPGVREAGFSAEEGSQFTVNLTREFERGKAKLFHRRTDDHGTWYLPVDLVNRAIDASYTQVGPLNRQVNIDYTSPLPGGGTELRRETFDLSEGRGWDGSLTGGSVEFDLGNGITFVDRMSLTQGNADTLGFVPDGAATTLGALRGVNGALLTGGTTATTGRTVDAATRVQQFGAWVVRKDIEAFTNDLSLAKSWNDSARVTVGYYSSNFSVDEQWALGNSRYYEQRQNGEFINEVACPLDINGDGDTADPGEAALVPQGQANSCGFNFDVNADGKASSDGLYVAGETTLGPVRLDAGVRFLDYAVQYTADTGALDGIIDTRADTDESKTAYTAAANWSINDVMGVFARINSGYLPPDFDTYRGFQNELHNLGEDLFQKVEQYEVGYKMSTGTVAVYATFFMNHVEGNPDCTVGGVDPCILVENEAQGIELDANLALPGGFSLDVNATYQDTEIQNGASRGNEIARQPPHQIRLTPSYYTQFADSIDATFYATFSLIDDRYSDNANTIVLDGYEKVDLGMLVNFDRLNFQVVVDNVTDEDALTEGDPRSPTAANGRYILPRNIRFSVGYNF